MARRFWSRPTVFFPTAALLLVLVAAAAWAFSFVDHLSHASAEERLIIDCEFGKFRQIMVRKKATDAILSHGGMSLIDERVDDLQVDTTNDDRPILNAIRGISKSEVIAVKELTVRLNDPSINADKLVLRQQANIEADHMSVETKSKEASGNLESYETTLNAKPVDGGTEVTLSVKMDVRVRVPKLLVSLADTKVKQAADEAIAGQASSIRSFIAKHADKRLILPEL